MITIRKRNGIIRHILAALSFSIASTLTIPSVYAEAMPQKLIVALDEYLNAQRRTFKAFAVRRPSKNDTNWYYAAVYDADTAERAAQQAEANCSPSILEPCSIFALGDSIVDGIPTARLRSAVQDYESDPKEIYPRHRLPDALQIWRARQAGHPEPTPTARHPSAELIRAFAEYRQVQRRTYKAFAFRQPDPFEPTWLFGTAYGAGSAESAVDQAKRACTDYGWRQCHLLAVGPSYVAKYPQQNIALTVSHYQADTKRPFRGRGLPNDLVKAWLEGDLDGETNSLLPNLEIDIGQREAARGLASLFGSSGHSTGNIDLVGVPQAIPNTETEVLTGVVNTAPPKPDVVGKPAAQQSPAPNAISSDPQKPHFPRYAAERFAVTYMSDPARDPAVALEYINRIHEQARGVPTPLEEAVSILVKSVILLEAGDYRGTISARGELSDLMAHHGDEADLDRILYALDGFMFEYQGEVDHAKDAFQSSRKDGRLPEIARYLREHVRFSDRKDAPTGQSGERHTGEPGTSPRNESPSSSGDWVIPKF